MSSVQTATNDNIVYLDMSEIIRPIPPVLDFDKVNSMKDTMSGSAPPPSCNFNPGDLGQGELPPVDVLTFKKSGKTYYFAFGGCHRLRAHDESGKQKVRCKLVNCSPNTLRLYLGATANKYLE
ncbi:sulfiredoxin [Schizosaccharomyces octosporus yFS286]|uniref:Sulfiredoxin n=1 Tax=Schizosaccharomyces octosporus (strain yFS286) TaxID=483514 RepID=S9R502_SCHOY|nr:sulfiredoxin [Schizosaccharomyces octosporus yFS286]EPX73425.1 sulfiredoxin [Schizosaccharomyces octosporus yFS286]